MVQLVVVDINSAADGRPPFRVRVNLKIGLMLSLQSKLCNGVNLGQTNIYAYRN